jgi:benzoyl-CoA reductase/2-hydroxyglutaryl-CoA dehydratase subunit BcrC/BadD/HgdB
MTGDQHGPDGRAWAEPLHAAALRPAAAASAWRAGTGGRVVGVLGWSVPRELVVAAGMLPVRLSPRRLAGGFSARDGATGLDRELPPGAARIAGGLLSGALDWVDAVLIGRDSEAHTKLFYLLRELRRSGAAVGLPPIAFFDLLRLPSRTSARYNRLRARELVDTLSRWAGRPVTPDDLGRAVDDQAATAQRLAALTALRTAPVPAVTGGDALAAALAAQVLPGEQVRAHLAAAGDAGTSAPPAARVFLAGSGLDDPAAYDALEDLGIALVGEDHEWGDDGSAPPARTADPLDGIVDRYHFGHGGVARDGLRDRAERTAGKITAAAADGVLYLAGERDEAAGWQLPALAERLGPDIPLVRVTVAGVPEDSRPALREAALRLLAEVRRG